MRLSNLAAAAATLIGALFLAAEPPHAATVVSKPNTATAPAVVPRQVLAYYYGWWATPSVSGYWGHWQGVDTATHTIASTRWYPSDGPYDSHNPVEVEKQNTEAQAASITGWVYSWWGPGSFPDTNVPLLLQTAARHGIKVAIAIEQLQGTTAAQNQTSAQTYLDYVLRNYTANPTYLKVNGRPVVFLNTVSLHAMPLTTWRTVITQAIKDTGITPFIAGDTNLKLDALNTCDAVYSYDLEHQQTENKTLAQIQGWAAPYYAAATTTMGDRLVIATVEPGHDASELATRPLASTMVTQRYNGGTYAAMWSGAIAADPDWILIVSWNEWHEGSQIEPSYQFGTQATDANTVFAKQFLARPAKSHVMN